MAVDNNEEKNKIVLNRKMRLWNKYKKPVIGVILAVVVIAVVAIANGNITGVTGNFFSQWKIRRQHLPITIIITMI